MKQSGTNKKGLSIILAAVIIVIFCAITGCSPQKKTTGNEVLEAYVEDVLLTEIGKCARGPFYCTYAWSNDGPYLENVQNESGVITSLIDDFDGDKKEELLVAVLKQKDISESFYSGQKANAVYLQMYEEQQGEVILASECLALENVLGAATREEYSWIFTHWYQNTLYICCSSRLDWYMFADGAQANLQVLTYDGNGFAIEIIQEQGGSMWDEDMTWLANELKKIGLHATADHLSSNPYAIASYIPENENYDEIILAIIGGNENLFYGDAYLDELLYRYFETNELHHVGSYKVEILTAEEYEDALKEAQEKSDEKGAVWKAKYIDYIHVNEWDADWEYQLVYIDDNDIPELYMKGMSTAQGDRLISIHHGETVETDLYNYGFSYIEKSGLFCDSGGHMDSYYDTVYSMNDGAVKVLESGSFGGGIDEIGEPDYQYFWNDEEMSEAEYQERLSQVFEKDDASKGYDFNLMNKNEIIDSLIRL